MIAKTTWRKILPGRKLALYNNQSECFINIYMEHIVVSIQEREVNRIGYFVAVSCIVPIYSKVWG